MRWSFRTNGNYIDFVHTDETSEAVESTIFHLHNTSRCVSWSLPSDTTRINFTIDETKYSNILITDIDFDGTAMNSQDDFETGITAMFTGLAGGGGGVTSVTAGDASITVGGTATEPTVKLPYKIYTGLVLQSGTDVPAKTDLQNTITGLAANWTRQGAGSYSRTLTPVARNKVFCLNATTQFDTKEIFIPIVSPGGGLDGYYSIVLLTDISDNVEGVSLRFYDSTFVATEMSGLITDYFHIQFLIFP